MNHLLSFFRRLYVLFVCPGAAHYVAGAPSLPPPLTPEQEKALLARMMQATAPRGMTSSPTTCGWWSTLPKSTKTPASLPRT